MNEEEIKDQPPTDSSVDDAALSPGSEASALEQPSKDIAPETTGESLDIQAEVSTEQPSSPNEEKTPDDPKWVVDLTRYHNDMNGLLSEKENLKLVALDKSVKPSFGRQWSIESNRVMRITSILRRRLGTAPKKSA